jgi:hypothetical protein
MRDRRWTPTERDMSRTSRDGIVGSPWRYFRGMIAAECVTTEIEKLRGLHESHVCAICSSSF